jgi:hypothetical protein
MEKNPDSQRQVKTMTCAAGTIFKPLGVSWGYRANREQVKSMKYNDLDAIFESRLLRQNKKSLHSVQAFFRLSFPGPSTKTQDNRPPKTGAARSANHSDL